VRLLSDLRFAVVGAYVVDCFVRTPALPVWDAEYEVRSVRTSPGGKALNQAVALARLGAQVTAVGVVGGDGFGRDILDLLYRERIDVTWMEQREGVPTAVCVCLVGDRGETSILWHIDDEAAIVPATILAASGAVEAADAVLLTFEMPAESIGAAIVAAGQWGRRVVVQPAPVLSDPVAARALPWAKVDLVVPNRAEARALLTGGEADEVADDQLARVLAGQLGVREVVVTLGAGGCVTHGPDGDRRYPAPEVAPVDATGGSDAFTATLVACLSAGADRAGAVEAAQRAAALAISHPGGHESMPRY
jgi:ribokinase